MNTLVFRTAAVAVLSLLAATAQAERNFGVGIKAGTLGAGIEGTWRPLPYMDLRVGGNLYDYEDSGGQAGINYDATLNLESFYGTVNFRVPLSPLRLTAGAFANGNELNLVSRNAAAVIEIGGAPYPADGVGTLSSRTTFAATAPYLGMGLDFSLFGRVGMNLDFGVLWQGEPEVTLAADGALASDPGFQQSLELERLELEDEAGKLKAWPVVSVGFLVNF